MRMLDAFCRRASAESTGSVVTAEFEVLPSMAASCIDKIYEMMTGTHPLVEQAISSGVFPGKFSYSPYLACLNGCLLHPKLALQALDNVMQNSRRFYNTLMQPVTNQVMLDLVGSLIQNPEELPVVDTNALTPLLTTLPAAQSDTSSGGGALSSKVEAEVRKLRLHHSFLTTGCSRTTLGMKLLLNRAGPFNPYVVLEEGRRRIEREIGMAPSTFDPWWRAMALALCVKVTNVFSECSPTLSEYFENWCSQQLDGNRKESRVVTNMFINTKGGALVAPSAPAEKKTARKKGMPDENSAFAPPTSKAPKKKKKKKKVKKPKSASLRKVGSASVSTNPLGTSQRSPSPSSTPFTG